MVDEAHGTGVSAAIPARSPSWDDWQTALAVAAHGSMNRAAQVLGVSQPTVARRLRSLESRLGISLFQAGPNATTLTAAGAAVLARAQGMGEAALAAEATAKAHRRAPGEALRITATSSVTLFLSRHLGDLAQATASRPIAFIPTRQRLDVAAGEADVALRMRSLPDDPAVRCRRVGRIAFALYGRPGVPDLPLIAPPDDPELRLQREFVARTAAGRRVVAHIGDMPSRHEAARTGLGIAVLPCWLGDADPHLARVPADDDRWAEDVYLLRPAVHPDRDALAALCAAIARLFKRHASELAGGTDASHR
ncbi:LysR family transcriptional regulator [uncultured Alsobacter sp.]|uniref:LysR family transcriptional regulator n=1 Tax=uncultured Alsobacter sp. TaxID=1748258 RepID=UPI0025F37B87|nr:LysR family transcriptional regulator [uncultured Alsobacter sp.]